MRATADALDERATEVAAAATRLAPALLVETLLTPVAGDVDQLSQRVNLTSRQSPVALGESWPTPDGLAIRVLAVDSDAWPRVLAENQFNDPPIAGMRMVMAEVEVTNQNGDGDMPRTIGNSDYRMVGDRGIVYTPYDSATRCGVIPNELDWELFGGATVTGNVCVIVPQDEGALRLIYQPGYKWDDQVVYFDLGN